MQWTRAGAIHSKKRWRFPTSFLFVRIIPYYEGKREDSQVNHLSVQEPRDWNGPQGQVVEA